MKFPFFFFKYTLIDNHSMDDVDGKIVGGEGMQVEEVSQRNFIIIEVKNDFIVMISEMERDLWHEANIIRKISQKHQN